MNYSLRPHEFHPELGYLWPSRQLRQNVRVGLAAAAFGIITGLAAAIVLLPRHGADPARSEYLLAGAPSGPAGDPAALLAPSPSVAPAGIAARIPTGASPKQPAPAAATRDELSATVQVPAQATPVTTTDRAAAPVSANEHIRGETKKRTKRTKANTRPRAREPYATDAYAASPFRFETRRFSDDTRSARRRDWGSSWSW
jgi:hypothetical protein